MGRVKAAMEAKLAAAFNPVRLEISDDTDHHKGHSGARDGGDAFDDIDDDEDTDPGEKREGSGRGTRDAASSVALAVLVCGHVYHAKCHVPFASCPSCWLVVEH